jgi:hypothetical protein
MMADQNIIWVKRTEFLEESDKEIVHWLARIQLGPLWVEEQYMAALDLANELDMKHGTTPPRYDAPMRKIYFIHLYTV